jgi:hypothetical protein
MRGCRSPTRRLGKENAKLRRDVAELSERLE